MLGSAEAQLIPTDLCHVTLDQHSKKVLKLPLIFCFLYRNHGFVTVKHWSYSFFNSLLYNLFRLYYTALTHYIYCSLLCADLTALKTASFH